MAVGICAKYMYPSVKQLCLTGCGANVLNSVDFETSGQSQRLDMSILLQFMALSVALFFHESHIR